MPSFGVENGLEEQNADRRKDDVIAKKLFDPGSDLDRVQVGGQDAGGGLHHGQQSRKGDGQQQEREEKFPVSGAKAEGGEEGAVDDKSPGAQRQDQSEEPDVAEGVEIEKYDEDGGQHRLYNENEEHVGEGFAEKEGGGGGGGHTLGLEDVVALLASPGLVEGGDGGEEEGYPEDATGDLACHRGVAGGVEGEAEDHDYQEGEEEHAVDGVARAPLEAEVFAEVVPDVAEILHAFARSLVRSARVASAARR